MGWDRKQFKGRESRPRHARVWLCVAHCEDCGIRLRVTHQVSRFGGRCRGCFSVSELVVVQWQAVSGVDPL